MTTTEPDAWHEGMPYRLHPAWPWPEEEPAYNWRPGKPPVARKRPRHTLATGATSMIRSAARREDFDLPDLAALLDLHAVIDAAAQDAVTRLRASGYSWAAIGRAIGTSAQNVQQRFGRVTA